SLGPILMGTIINVFFYGIMVVQCYLYFLWYKKDRNWIKAVVLLLLFLDTLSTIFDILMTYDYLVLSFGNFIAIGIVNVGIAPYPLLTGITSWIVQSFFAWRISVLTNTVWFSAGIFFLSVVQMLASIATAVWGEIVHQLAELTKVKSAALIWLVGSVATDLGITIILVVYLRRRKTGFSSTDDIVSKIIRATVQTGLLTSACALAVVIAYLVSNTSMHLAFGVPLSKLYTNSLMSTLNMRQGWNNSGLSTLKLPASGPTGKDTFPSMGRFTAPNASQTAISNQHKSVG
ncbi:hypothetical protein BU17DRAFT_55863, partial [Hysterangium stoloniferum]